MHAVQQFQAESEVCGFAVLKAKAYVAETHLKWAQRDGEQASTALQLNTIASEIVSRASRLSL